MQREAEIAAEAKKRGKKVEVRQGGRGPSRPQKKNTPPPGGGRGKEGVEGGGGGIRGGGKGTRSPNMAQ